MCHQTVSLVARHLEAQGVPTVIMGCARDIVESCGAARFLFSNFPLGNSCGKPNDLESQTETLKLALSLFDAATGPKTTLVSGQRWAKDDAWQRDFMNVAALTDEQLARRRQEFESQKIVANQIKQEIG